MGAEGVTGLSLQKKSSDLLSLFCRDGGSGYLPASELLWVLGTPCCFVLLQRRHLRSSLAFVAVSRRRRRLFLFFFLF